MVIMNMDSVCRTCLSSVALWPLFPMPAQQRNFARALYFSTGLQIQVDDGLPQKICQVCANTIEDAMRFRLRSQAAEKQLQLFKDKLDVHTDGKKSTCKETITLKEVEITWGNEEAGDAFSNDSFMENEECEKNISTSSRQYDKPKKKDGFIERNIKSLKDIKSEKDKELEKVCSAGNGKYCTFCKKKFNGVNYLKIHIMWRHLDPKILCEFCGKICRNSTSLVVHQRSKHGVARDKKLLCSLCDFNALYKMQLEEHVRSVHTKERLYPCKMCDARFFTRRVLLQHSAIHSTERPFDCHICSKKFRLRNDLTSHIHRRHTKRYKKTKCNTKKYRYGCYLCSKMYDTCYGARQHIEKIHGLPFKNQDKLKRHLREGFEAKE